MERNWSEEDLDLVGVAADRLFPALEAILLDAHAGRVLLAHADALGRAIPEIAQMANCPQNSPYHLYDVLGHTARVVDASPATPLSRWAALLHDVGKPQCRWTDRTGRDHFTGHATAGAEVARDLLTRLKAPEQLLQDVCLLVEKHEWFGPADSRSVQRGVAELGGRMELYRALLALQAADSSAKAPAAAARLDHVRLLQARLETDSFSCTGE